MVITKHIDLETEGNTDVIDVTARCQSLLDSSGLSSGVLTVFNPGSTGGMTTIEYEPNLVRDLKEALEVLAPSGKTYHHAKTWHDDNGSGHIRSTVVGPSLSVPFSDGTLILGTWQQIIFCDFDNTPRSRSLVVQIMGE